MTLCWSLDKAGPIARSPADAWLVFRAIAPTRAGAPGHLGADVRGLKIGHVPSWFEGESEASGVERKALDALRDAGCDLVRVSLPQFPYGTLRTILAAEAAASMEDLTLSGRVDELAQQDANSWPNRLRAARFLSAVDFVQADRLRRRVADAFDEVFQPLDAMIGPSFGGPMLLATNFTGHPCLVVRAGFMRSRPRNLFNQPQREGEPAEVPWGISLWAKPYDESVLVRLGSAIESRLGVADRRPAGF
jgi:Asp-tRNA(Asn)/Glu-tRNA(Gln) amidotransferase A subunit family amidase